MGDKEEIKLFKISEFYIQSEPDAIVFRAFNAIDIVEIRSSNLILVNGNTSKQCFSRLLKYYYMCSGLFRMHNDR